MEENIENTTGDATEQAPAELNIRDLANLKFAIELATSRAAFKADELAAVGIAYNKLSVFLEQIASQAAQSQDASQSQEGV